MTSTEKLAEINAIAAALDGKLEGVKELAAHAIARDWSIEQFRDQIKASMPETRALRPVALDISQRDASRYSISRAILNGAHLDGVERELHQELCSKVGAPRNGNVWVPHQMLATRAGLKADAAAGGNLVGTQHLGSEYIELLRNKALIMRLGARSLNSLQQDIAIPRHVTACEAQWLTETEASTATDLAWGQVAMSPKGCVAHVEYSRLLLTQAIPQVDNIISRDIISQIGLACDRAAIHGASGGFTGAIATSGVNLITLATNAASFLTMGPTAHAACLSLEAALAVSNADSGSVCFLTNPKVRAQLRQCDVSASTATGNFVWTAGKEPGTGMILNYPAYCTN